MTYIGIIGSVLILYYFYNKFIRWIPTSPQILNTDKLFIYGHRGVPAQAPENTIYSFQKAFELNVDGIELDVQITKDNVLVVHHDPHLERLTGKKTFINTLTYKKLLSIDARGIGYDSLAFQQIPRLDDILEILPDNIAINIEIKSQRLFSEGMEQPVIDSILKHDLLNRTIISSFNPLRILKVKLLQPNVTTAQLWDIDEKFSSILWVYLSRPDLLHGNIDQFNEDIIAKFKALGMKVYAYTVNSDKQLAKAMQLNINGIFIDNPALLK